jgi:hypothetical protein
MSYSVEREKYNVLQILMHGRSFSIKTSYFLSLSLSRLIFCLLECTHWVWLCIVLYTWSGHNGLGVWSGTNGHFPGFKLLNII